MRRIKMFKITDEFIGDLLRSTGDDCLILRVDGVPKDAVFLGLWVSQEENVVYAKYEHESFEEVKEYAILPVGMINFTRYFV